MVKSRLFVSVALAVALVVGFALTGCAQPAKKLTYEEYVASLGPGEYPVPEDCFNQALEEGELHFYNWEGWWPEEIFEEFSDFFGIKVIVDGYADTDEMVAKFRLNPETPYDLVCGNARTQVWLMAINVTQELNHDWIPNVNHYLSDLAKDLWVDPDYQHQVSWDLYSCCYGYNSDYVSDNRTPSWAVLLEPREEYSGRVTMVTSVVEVIGAALKYLGYSYNSVNQTELDEARDLLLAQKEHVMAYDSWPLTSVLEEDTWLLQMWFGDLYYFHREKPSIVAAYPTEGGSLGADNLFIPVGSQNPAAAHLFLNELFRPETMATLINWVGFFPTHTGIDDLLDADLKAWFPDEEYLEKCEWITEQAFDGEGLEMRIEIWEELVG